MIEGFWDLPGPEEFARDVEKALRDRHCAVAALPRYAPAGLVERVENRLRHTGTEWRTFAAANPSPLRDLGAAFLPPSRGRETTLANLVERFAELGGGVLRVEVGETDRWPPWRDFFADYAAAILNLDHFDKTALFATVAGVAPTDLPAPQPGLVVLLGDGVATEPDWRMLALVRGRSRGDGSLARRLATETAFAVGAGDPALLERLSIAPLSDLLDPRPLVRALAAERGAPIEGALDWHEGGRDGEFETAMGLLIRGQEEAIARRVWEAQLAVLLPYAEMRREALVPRLGRFVTLPVRRNFGQGEELVTRAEDLEIGELWHLCGRRPDVPQPVRDELRVLRELRNRLAHRQTVDEDLFSALRPATGS